MVFVSILLFIILVFFARVLIQYLGEFFQTDHAYQ